MTMAISSRKAKKGSKINGFNRFHLGILVMRSENPGLEAAESTLRMAEVCFENKGFRDAVNRSYYAAFYALRSVLALEGVDFKRHKDVIAYFNQHYVATDKFERYLGKRIGRLKTMREDCDYDDFYGLIIRMCGIKN